MRHYYAASTCYSTDASYETGGYTVHCFRNKADRNAWVDRQWDDPDKHRTREAIDYRTACKIEPQLRNLYPQDIDRVVMHPNQIRVWIEDTTTGRPLQNLGTVLTDNPGRAVQRFEEYTLPWAEANYNPVVCWDWD